jgi:hypothetical protein
MPDDPHQIDNGTALWFWGKVIASLSHELANAIGILSQSTGLFGDLLDGCEPDHPIDPERLRVIRERLDRQTSRASDLVQQLNYFAHSADQQSTEVELNSVARNLVAISSRLALMKGVELRLDCTVEKVRVTGDPYGLLQTLFLALEYFYEDAGSGGTVEIIVANEPAGIQLRSADVLWEVDDRFATAQTLAARMGGRASLERFGQGTVFTLRTEPG